jgi:hypothetical protein
MCVHRNARGKDTKYFGNDKEKRRNIWRIQKKKQVEKPALPALTTDYQTVRGRFLAIFLH